MPRRFEEPSAFIFRGWRISAVAIFKADPGARKFNVPVDFDAYQSWLLDRPQPYLESSSNINGMSDSAGTAPATSSSSQSALPSATETPSSSEQAPYPTSFAQIVELISTGQPIPGIKEVPSTILEGQSSETTAQTRRKPWEKDEPATSEHAPSEAAPLTTAGE